MPQTDKKLERAVFPEQVGIDSKEIEALINDYYESGIELHSLMLLRHGKVAFEGYAAPYGRDVPQTMYSVSKSVTSVAMGFAIAEGLLSLDSKVIDFFPEYRPAKRDEYLEQLTVYHLMTMTAGKQVSALADKSEKDWIRQFFRSKWAAQPGKKWAYISENTYMCSAILHRATGMGLVDYLMPRLFEPLGFTRRPEWETDSMGIEAGGWGLRLSPDELARFTLCVQQGGVFAGEQIIPADYIADATSNHVKAVSFEDPDQSRGYGYFFWQSVMKNTVRCDGMFSQFGVAFRDFDACLVCTCSEISEKKTRDCFFRHFPKMFIEESDKNPVDGVYPKLLPLESLPAGEHCITEGLMKSKVIRTEKNAVLNAVGFPVSMLPLPAVYMSYERSGNIDNIVLDFNGDEMTMVWDEGKDHNKILCGMDGKPRTSKIHLGGMDYTAVSYAAWKNFETLEIRMRPLEAVSERRILINLNVLKGKAEIIPSSMPPISAMGRGIGEIMRGSIPTDTLKGATADLMSHLDLIVDSKIKGKIKF